MGVARMLRCLWVLVVIGPVVAGLPSPASAQQLTAKITANRPTISRGDTLTLTVTRQNPSLAGNVVDFYAGVLLPDSHTLYFFTPAGTVIANTSNLTGVRPLEPAVDLSAAGTVSFQLLSLQFLDLMPSPGTYLLFYVGLTPNALADGIVGPGELLAAATTAVRVDTLSSVAAGRGLRIGAAIQPQFIAQDPLYGPTLASDFSQIIPENQMKFGPLRPTSTTFNFAPADTLVDFAIANSMAFHGHTLVWHQQLPAWLTNGSWTRDQLIEILRTHIHTVVDRYRGRVASWDVVNEGLDETGQLRNTIWRTVIGDDYIELVFRWANEADPGAKLFYNEFDAEGLGTKSDAVYNLVQTLLAKGVPIHGVGLQMHISQTFAPSAQSVVANMHRLAALGLQTRVSEMDLRLAVPASPLALLLQAQVYADMVQACLTVNACVDFATWGFTDKFSWIPGNFPGTGEALPIDEAYHAKPAYRALITTLRGEQFALGNLLGEFHVDPAGTYLTTAGSDTPKPATSIDLVGLGLRAGDIITLHSVGSYVSSSTSGDTRQSLAGVFHGGGFLAPGTDSIYSSVVTPPTFSGGIPTDIPQDFLVPTAAGLLQLRIPVGATSILFTPVDSFFRDNSDPDGDFRVRLFKQSL